MAEGERALSGLKRVLLLFACIFQILLCAAMCVVLSILIDVRQEVKTLRSETEHVVSLLGTMGAITKAKVSESVQLGCAAKDNPAAQQEINYLLSCIGRSKLQFEYGGEQHDADWVQAKLFGKTILMCTEVAATEDFIEKVAAQTHEGHIYYVLEKSGERKELRAWLYERLEERRKSPAPAHP